MKKIMIFILITVLLVSCTPTAVAPSTGTATIDPLTPIERARVTLTAYLDALSHQDYERAAQYYGGDLEILTGYNPTLDPLDVPGLFKNGCELNGLMCLPPLRILKEDAVSDGRFEFTVQLVNKEGEVFEIGACCGADPEDVTPVSQFVFEVEKQGDQFKVLTLPPYVP